MTHLNYAILRHVHKACTPVFLTLWHCVKPSHVKTYSRYFKYYWEIQERLNNKFCGSTQKLEKVYFTWFSTSTWLVNYWFPNISQILQYRKFCTFEKRATKKFYIMSHFSLREKCPNTKLFLVRIFLYSDWI